MNSHLVGEGVYLRPPEPADVPAMVDAVVESQPDLGHWLVWAVPRYSRREAAAWCEHGHQDRQLSAFHVFDTGGVRLLGGVGFHGFDPNNGKAELGYWVRSSARGSGVAVAAARVALTDLFERTATERVELIIAVDNHASQRVALKLGAIKEGILRRRLALATGPSDAQLFGLLRSDFAPVPLERTSSRSGPVARPGAGAEHRGLRRWTRAQTS